MKKRSNVLLCIFSFLFILFTGLKVEAKTALIDRPTHNIVGEVLATTQIYDNGKIQVNYKYGLRRINAYYCDTSTVCDSEEKFNIINIMESTSENPYKNTGEEMDTYSYQLKLETGKEYRVKVEIYVGSYSNYTGQETVMGISKDTHDTEDKVVIISTNNVSDENIRKLLDKITNITNTFILPVIFILLGIYFVIKGAILGVQIVKSADSPEIRIEKVRTLKWLVIGVAVAYCASGLVGIITGYFESLFQ